MWKQLSTKTDARVAIWLRWRCAVRDSLSSHHIVGGFYSASSLLPQHLYSAYCVEFYPHSRGHWGLLVHCSMVNCGHLRMVSAFGNTTLLTVYSGQWDVGNKQTVGMQPIWGNALSRIRWENWYHSHVCEANYVPAASRWSASVNSHSVSQMYHNSDRLQGN